MLYHELLDFVTLLQERISLVAAFVSLKNLDWRMQSCPTCSLSDLMRMESFPWIHGGADVVVTALQEKHVNPIRVICAVATITSVATTILKES
jgi:hypothetical protein